MVYGYNVFENKTKSTTVGSTTLQWCDASINDMVINDLDEAEAEVEAMFEKQETDGALDALKAKMAGGKDDAGSAPVASPETDPIEDELAKLRAALETEDDKSP